MNFVKYEKIQEETSRTRTLKVFNTNFIKSYCDLESDEKSFLWGLLKTQKTKLKTPQIKAVKIFNIPLLKLVRKDWIEKYYFLGIYFYKKDYRKIFLKKNKNFIKPQDKNIFILCGHHGETYCASAFYIGAILKKYKNVKFLCYENCHEKMFNLFWQGILPPIEKLKSFKTACNELGFSCKGINVKKIYTSSENPQNKHVVDLFLENLNLKREDLYKKDFSLTQEDKDQFKEKLEKMNLNSNNFILLAPEACAFGELEDDFWINLSQKLKEKNYDIFVNMTNPKPWAQNLEHTFLTHKEVIQLAPCAKAIISTRSGFSELLSYFNIPMHVIYRNRKDYKKEELDNIIQHNTIKKYPFVRKDLIFEYNYHKEDKNNLIEKIISSISNIK